MRGPDRFDTKNSPNPHGEFRFSMVRGDYSDVTVEVWRWTSRKEWKHMSQSKVQSGQMDCPSWLNLLPFILRRPTPQNTSIAQCYFQADTPGFEHALRSKLRIRHLQTRSSPSLQAQAPEVVPQSSLDASSTQPRIEDKCTQQHLEMWGPASWHPRTHACKEASPVPVPRPDVAVRIRTLRTGRSSPAFSSRCWWDAASWGCRKLADNAIAGVQGPPGSKARRGLGPAGTLGRGGATGTKMPGCPGIGVTGLCCFTAVSDGSCGTFSHWT